MGSVEQGSPVGSYIPPSGFVTEKMAKLWLLLQLTAVSKVLDESPHQDFKSRREHMSPSCFLDDACMYPKCKKCTEKCILLPPHACNAVCGTTSLAGKKKKERCSFLISWTPVHKSVRTLLGFKTASPFRASNIND